MIVSATNSTNTKAAPIIVAPTPPSHDSGAPRKTAAAVTGGAKNSTKEPLQEAFLLHSQSNPNDQIGQNSSKSDTVKKDTSSSSTSSSSQYYNRGAVVLDAVPWQAASRRQFLRTMAGILNTLAQELDTKKPVSANLKAQQLSLYLASLQLYDIVLSGGNGGGGGGGSRGKEIDINEGGEEDILADICTINDNTTADKHHNQHQKQSMHSSNLDSPRSSDDASLHAENALDEARAVLERSDALSSSLKKENSGINTTFLPNPWQLCHSAALEWAAAAASEELLGNYTRSKTLYCRAGTVLHFLSAEAGTISSIVALPAMDEVKLRRCASAAAVRWAVCSSFAGREGEEE